MRLVADALRSSLCELEWPVWDALDPESPLCDLGPSDLYIKAGRLVDADLAASDSLWRALECASGAAIRLGDWVFE